MQGQVPQPAAASGGCVANCQITALLPQQQPLLLTWSTRRPASLMRLMISLSASCADRQVEGWLGGMEEQKAWSSAKQAHTGCNTAGRARNAAQHAVQ